MTAVLALSTNNVFAVDNKLPWHIPHDLQFFKANTWGGTCVMGRRTWESLPRRFRPLPGRRNIVLTHTANIDNVETAQMPEEIPKNAYWIGGKAVLDEAFCAKRIHTIVLTRVHVKIHAPNALKIYLPPSRPVYRSRVFENNGYTYHFEIRAVL